MNDLNGTEGNNDNTGVGNKNGIGASDLDAQLERHATSAATRFETRLDMYFDSVTATFEGTEKTHTHTHDARKLYKIFSRLKFFKALIKPQ